MPDASPIVSELNSSWETQSDQGPRLQRTYAPGIPPEEGSNGIGKVFESRGKSHLSLILSSASDQL